MFMFGTLVSPRANCDPLNEGIELYFSVVLPKLV